MGLMKIGFSHKMNSNITKEYLNSTFIDIFVTPVDLYDSAPKRDVNLTWEVVSFGNKTLEIQMNYSSPLDISNQKKFDNITFHVINSTDIFRSESGLNLNDLSKNLTSKIKR